MTKRDLFAYAALIVVEVALYRQGIFDASHVWRVVLCLAIYTIGRLGLRYVKASEAVKDALASALLSVLLIWLLKYSWSIALWVIAVVWFRFFRERASSH